MMVSVLLCIPTAAIWEKKKVREQLNYAWAVRMLSTRLSFVHIFHRNIQNSLPVLVHAISKYIWREGSERTDEVQRGAPHRRKLFLKRCCG